jgi:putative heme-binding domain-containing protein
MILVVLATACSANENNHRHGSVVSATVAPAWSLPDATQQTLSSEDFAGRPYILLLHLGNECLHCSEQLTAFANQRDIFRQHDTDIVAVSTDTTAGLIKSLADYGDKFPLENLVSDPSLTTFKQFGAFDSKANVPLHGTFLIDGTGRIRWSNIGSHPFKEPNRLLSEVKLVTSGATTLQEDEQVDRPKVFLDKSPRVVAYQLQRLNNEKLLRVQRKIDDKKYAPVFYAILTRDGMSPRYREEALAGLAAINQTSPASELLVALGKSKAGNLQETQTANELSKLLLAQPADALAIEIETIVAATTSENSVLRSASFATLMVAGKQETAWKIAAKSQPQTLDCLSAVSLIPDSKLRAELLPEVSARATDKHELKVRNAAIKALGFIPAGQSGIFSSLADAFSDAKLRNEAVRTMLKIPTKYRDVNVCMKLLASIVEHAESTPAESRTTDPFIDAMQLADELLAIAASDKQAKTYRERLEKVSVRVVRILTVEEEMRYDVPYFAVQAGRPVQVVLKNEDLMGHNLVICKTGKLKQVANDGLAAGPNDGLDGKQYVPKTDDVLFATDMVGAHDQERLTFDAPEEPGEYPYVCTFPNHWPRMYGVMVVVDDLNNWMQNPTEPKDPIGSTRKLVQKWTVDDFAEELSQGPQGQGLEIGKKIFTEATCAQCHQLSGEGGNVGPELDEVFTRWKNDRTAVMREILEPSHRIDEKYSMHMILTIDGVAMSGIIKSQNDQQIELIDNPTSTETTKVLKDDIEEMVKTSTSIMPKALMDNFSKSEVLEMLYYIEMSAKQPTQNQK